MNDNPELMEKLAKILRLANDKAAQPGEIEAAMALAAALARKHNIDLAMVSLEDKSGSKLSFDIGREEMTIRSQNFQLYHRWIFAVLMEVFGVKVILFSRKFCLIGESTDILICKQLFPWLEDMFCHTYHVAARTRGLERNNATRRGIYFGLYRGIVEVNKRAEEKLERKDKDCLAMVLRNKEDAIAQRVAVDFPKLRTTKSRSTSISNEAYHIGQNEGRKIKLHQMQNGAQQNHLTQ